MDENDHELRQAKYLECVAQTHTANKALPLIIIEAIIIEILFLIYYHQYILGLDFHFFKALKILTKPTNLKHRNSIYVKIVVLLTMTDICKDN